MPHFDHLVCAHHNDSNLAELVGHIDVGTADRYHLSPVCLKLRKGHEAADLDRMLAYLQANRARIIAAFAQAAKENDVPRPWPDSAFHDAVQPATPKPAGPVRVGPRKITPATVTVPAPVPAPAPVVRRFPVKKVQA